MSNIFTEIRKSICIEIDTLARKQGLPTASQYVESSNNYDGKYGVLPASLKVASGLLDKTSPSVSPLYNRYITSYYGELCLKNNHDYNLPQSIKNLLQNDLRRIRNQLDTLPDSFYQLTNEPFLKDLAIVRNRLIPVGAEYAEIGKRLWKGVMLRGNFRQMIAMFILIFMKSARSNNFLNLHLHSLNVIRLEKGECTEMYTRIAELMILNPQISGIVNSGWFIDPLMKEISPHLFHLNSYPRTHGAYIFFVHQEGANSDALTSSPTRQLMYETGHYQPSAYMCIWLRADILKLHSFNLNTRNW